MNLTEQLKTYANQSATRIPNNAQHIMKAGIDELVNSSILNNALKTGDTLPNATLINAQGNKVELYDVLKSQKLVITFYRGGWCPYCNMELRAYQEHLTRIEAKGAKLVAITPETPDNSLSTSEKNNLKFEVLSDIDNAFARSLGLVFKLPLDLQEVYKGFGINLDDNQQNTHQELPIAATYIVEQDGTVSYHHLEEDYKLRANPEDVIANL